MEAALDAGDDVALVNLGDVSLYATAYYILDLIRADGYVAAMLPGVTSICAVAARLGRSLTRMEEPVHNFPTKLWTRSRRRGFWTGRRWWLTAACRQSRAAKISGSCRSS